VIWFSLDDFPSVFYPTIRAGLLLIKALLFKIYNIPNRKKKVLEKTFSEFDRRYKETRLKCPQTLELELQLFNA